MNDYAQLAFNRLGWAIDRRDWDAVTATLAPTVRLDYTELFGGDVTTTSRQQVADQWRGMIGGLDGTQHVITGAQATAGEDGALLVTANVVAAHVKGTTPPWVIGGWYEATLVASADGYAVSSLTLHPTWESGSRDILS